MQASSNMSLEFLGSLAQTVSDRYLRESFRRTLTSTTMSVASVMDGEYTVVWRVPYELVAAWIASVNAPARLNLEQPFPALA